MAEKGEAEAGGQAAERPAQSGRDVLEMLDGLVGQFPPFRVAPHILGRVELGGVGGQPLHLQPLPLSSDVLLGDAGLVAGKLVPDQNDSLSPEVLLEGFEEGDDVWGLEAARVSPEDEATAATIPTVSHSPSHGELVPVAGMGQDRRLALGCPGAADRRAFADAALVLEDDPGPVFAAVFFTRGQSAATQRRIAFSSRSFALRVGRCKLQPRPWRRILHT